VGGRGQSLLEDHRFVGLCVRAVPAPEGGRAANTIPAPRPNICAEASVARGDLSELHRLWLDGAIGGCARVGQLHRLWLNGAGGA
jgi:hypothetical protein